MPRVQRIDLGNYIYHVINRSNGRGKIFHNDADYQDFEYLLNEIKEEYGMRIVAYVIMPNHWHLLLYPRESGDLARSLQWLGTSHARRHHTRKGTIGGGHLYQGRYKSFLVEKDSHFLTVLKYIERNPVRAKLCKRVEDWKWGSAYRRKKGAPDSLLLESSPVDLPKDYEKWVNRPEPTEQLKEVRESVNKGTSFGEVIVPKNIMQ